MKIQIYSLLMMLQITIYSQNGTADPVWQLDALEAYPLRLTVRVIDEAGDPLEGSHVKVGFFNLKEKGEYRYFEGDTKIDGKYNAEFSSHASDCPIEVTKKGFYKSRKVYDGVYNDYLIARDKGRFEPWNPTVDVVLKKIGKPIPMYVRGRNTARIFVPNLNGKFSFDLLEWDWLPPNGKGKIADWDVEVKNISDDKTNSQLTVTINFPNELDGMIRIKDLTGTESRLRSPRTAPGEGYNIRDVEFGNHTSRDKIIENDSVAESAQAYIMRIRTVKDTNGKIISSQYGKLIEYPGTKVPIFDVLGIKNDQGQIIYGFQVNAIYINPSVLDQNLEYNQTTLYPNIENYVWDP